MSKTSREQMDAMIKQHWDAEIARDPKGATVMMADDVHHDIVGYPGGPINGPAAVVERYGQMFPTIKTNKVTQKPKLYGDDFCVEEAEMECIAEGRFLGFDGRNRPVKFRILHIFKFADEKMTMEQVWLDGGSIAHQLG